MLCFVNITEHVRAGRMRDVEDQKVLPINTSDFNQWQSWGLLPQRHDGILEIFFFFSVAIDDYYVIIVNIIISNAHHFVIQ